MIQIITDSSSNITPEEAEKLGISLMPLTIMFGTEELKDGIDIDCDMFYKRMAESRELPHTAQLTGEQIESEVKKALNDGKEVLIMPIASALSGSFERCKTVAAKYEHVYAYDTKCTTVMLKALVLEALKNADKSIEEIIKILDELRPRYRIYAALNTLENLKKGGRLSKASAIIGTVLNIKPVITFSPEGKVELISKQFGINKGIKYIVSKVQKDKIDFSKPVYLIYTADSGNSDVLIEKLGIEYTEKLNICPVIGTHIGPDACGIVFAEK